MGGDRESSSQEESVRLALRPKCDMTSIHPASSNRIKQIGLLVSCPRSKLAATDWPSLTSSGGSCFFPMQGCRGDKFRETEEAQRKAVEPKY